MLIIFRVSLFQWTNWIVSHSTDAATIWSV